MSRLGLEHTLEHDAAKVDATRNAAEVRRAWAVLAELGVERRGSLADAIRRLAARGCSCA